MEELLAVLHNSLLRKSDVMVSLSFETEAGTTDVYPATLEFEGPDGYVEASSLAEAQKILSRFLARTPVQKITVRFATETKVLPDYVVSFPVDTKEILSRLQQASRAQIYSVSLGADVVDAWEVLLLVNPSLAKELNRGDIIRNLDAPEYRAAQFSIFDGTTLIPLTDESAYLEFPRQFQVLVDFDPQHWDELLNQVTFEGFYLPWKELKQTTLPKKTPGIKGYEYATYAGDAGKYVLIGETGKLKPKLNHRHSKWVPLQHLESPELFVPFLAKIKVDPANVLVSLS